VLSRASERDTMTNIRNPRYPLLWESDGEYNGKYMAEDGTLHDDANAVLKYEKERRETKPVSETRTGRPFGTCIDKLEALAPILAARDARMRNEVLEKAERAIESMWLDVPEMFSGLRGRTLDAIRALKVTS
jgi:hypothetical protein